MLVRSISQLPRIDTDFTNGLFEVSVPASIDSSLCCTSKSLSFESLSRQVKNELSVQMVSDYGLDSITGKIDVSSEVENVHALMSDDF